MRRAVLVLMCGAVLPACRPPVTTPTGYLGYVEGEYVYLSVPVAGYLQELPVRRGAHLSTGALAFAVAADRDQHVLDEATARVAAADARALNLADGRRTPEVDAAQAAIDAARAALELATVRLARDEQLAKDDVLAVARLDESRSAEKQARANFAAVEAQWRVALQPVGRTAERRAAAADASAARAAVAQQTWVQQHSRITSPTEGDVVETYFTPGEWVPAGKPVVGLLPDSARLVRFFVPESAVAQVRPGQRVAVHCDGCPAGLAAVVEAIASKAEFAPPVIYSKGQRETLVFRVDARPAPGTALAPGLPVDVTW